MTNQISINKRDLTIAYNIDNKSVTELANSYGITHSEMKQVIRNAGLTVRKSEEKTVNERTYNVVLVDGTNETTISFKN